MKIQAVRLRIFKNTPLSVACLPFVKLSALPTANKKAGKTRSVTVKPCHAACSKGANGVAPLPGVLTMIMKQTVMPLNTSSDKKRDGELLILTKLDDTV